MTALAFEDRGESGILIYSCRSRKSWSHVECSRLVIVKLNWRFRSIHYTDNEFGNGCGRVDNKPCVVITNPHSPEPNAMSIAVLVTHLRYRANDFVQTRYEIVDSPIGISRLVHVIKVFDLFEEFFDVAGFGWFFSFFFNREAEDLLKKSSGLSDSAVQSVVINICHGTLGHHSHVISVDDLELWSDYLGMVTHGGDLIMSANASQLIATEIEHLINLGDCAGNDSIMSRFEIPARDILQMIRERWAIEEHLKKVAQPVSFNGMLEHFFNVLPSRPTVIRHWRAELSRHASEYWTRQIRQAAFFIGADGEGGIAVKNCVDILREKDARGFVVHSGTPCLLVGLILYAQEGGARIFVAPLA